MTMIGRAKIAAAIHLVDTTDFDPARHIDHRQRLDDPREQGEREFGASDQFADVTSKATIRDVTHLAQPW